MSYLSNNSEFLSARITNKGRQKISEGNFVISYFQIGDSEFDYNFPQLDGSSNTKPGQKVLAPMDKDAIVKYPYKLSDSEVTGTTYGQPIQSSEPVTIINNMGPAGFVSEHKPYTTTPLSGAEIICEIAEIPISALNGTNTIQIPTTNLFAGTEYITVFMGQLIGSNSIIPTASTSLVYKILDIITGETFNTLIVDRITPNLSTFTGMVTLIANFCDPNYIDPETNVNCIPLPLTNEKQQDPWALSIVWSAKPAGLVSPLGDENLTGYTGNVYVSSKEFFGYTSSNGQTVNTGTTITNSCGETISVAPEEQHSLAIVHYEGIGDNRDPDKYFKYEDYIATTEDAKQYFEVYIPFIQYHRNTGTTIGAKFHMGGTDNYLNSAASDTKPNKMKYRDLVDEQNNRVGKIFVDHQVIIFDDQEIVAALDYKSNRRYTLPIPKVGVLPLGYNCTPSVETSGLISGTGDTIYISYLFEYSGATYMNGMHCNHYAKTSAEMESDVSIKFCTDGFRYMKKTQNDYKEGFIAHKFKILAQKVQTGEQPLSEAWRVIDYTDDIPNHTSGLIDPDNMKGSAFVLTNNIYESAPVYNLENYLGALPDEPSSLPEFGDEQPFTGSIKLTRASDIHMMNFLINLPSGQFESTQNPTYIQGADKKITEVALLDSNKEVLVIAKTAAPLTRIGSQIISVRIDF